MNTIGHIDEYRVQSVMQCIQVNVSQYYPGAFEWYLKCLSSSDHHIIDDYYGFAIVKKSENKICTVFVYEGFRGNGYVINLFESCFRILGTRKPFLTVSEEALVLFKGVFDFYGFDITSVVDGMYRRGKKEYIYNEICNRGDDPACSCLV